ncbi:ABC-ATPase domain-containing protein [Candidatus Bipolaricaulota bacterium]|nr:ABC-ATPase domain-containing protein [Candidatus Bipolaricaulota bacterium]
MRDHRELERILRRLNGKGYGAYKDIEGVWRFPDFVLFVDHVQGDPFATPSRLRVRVPMEVAGIPRDFYRNRPRKVALEDFLVRVLARWIPKLTKGNRGSGHSGRFAVVTFGQCILPRTAVWVTEDHVEAILAVGLPAAGRRILGHEAAEMLLSELPALVREGLLFRNLDKAALREHVACGEDAEALREQLRERKLVAFVAEGAILPRESGISDRPLKEGAVPFEPPPSLAVTLERPNRGPIRGMGIPEGVTLIVGGGYHGKSTLLSALAQGVYNHIPGDGREYVVTRREAVVIRAEDGRFVCGVDISPFIDNLPNGTDTRNFSTQNASGSTSQAANIMEALEAGAKVLLVDEDTSATNFMIRDERMQELVAKEKEPITPFLDKVKPLFRDYGVSSILVMGGSGDYFEVADTVIMMDAYRPVDVTERAKEIVRKHPLKRRPEGGEHFGPIPKRILDLSSIRARTPRGKLKIRATKMALQLGNSVIDLSRIHQIAEVPQARAIGYILAYISENARRFMGKPLVEILDEVERTLEREGLWPFLPARYGDLAAPRRFELAFALNRLRTLRLRD